MPIKVRRGLFKVGETSLAVILPKPWVDYYGLKPGDIVEVIADDEVTIRIYKEPPETPEDQKTRIEV